MAWYRRCLLHTLPLNEDLECAVGRHRPRRWEVVDDVTGEVFHGIDMASVLTDLATLHDQRAYAHPLRGNARIGYVSARHRDLEMRHAV